MTDDELIAQLQNLADDLSSAAAARITREAADRIAQLTSRTDEPSDDELADAWDKGVAEATVWEMQRRNEEIWPNAKRPVNPCRRAGRLSTTPHNNQKSE